MAVASGVGAVGVSVAPPERVVPVTVGGGVVVGMTTATTVGGVVGTAVLVGSVMTAVGSLGVDPVQATTRKNKKATANCSGLLNASSLLFDAYPIP